MIRAIAILAALLFALTVHALAQNAPHANIGEGQRLFVEHCSSCHGLALQGSDQAPPLINVDAVNVDFELRTGRMPAQVPWEQEFDKPSPFSGQQIGDIIAYVMSKSTGNKVLPVIGKGDVERGREVFAENCQQCHDATGHGESVGYADIAPSLMDVQAEQIAEAVRMGPDVMPPFGPKVIDAQKLDDVVSYVRFTQHGQYNPGGLQLANLGPVAEGFVGWVFGMGLIVLLARRIGTSD